METPKVLIMEIAIIVTQFLVLIVFLLGCAFVVRFHWRRREMYRLASKIRDVVPSYPIIGIALSLLGPTGDVQRKINEKLDECYPSFLKGWLGLTLFVAVSNPEHLETILNHKHCLNKSDKYVALEMILGHGLISAKAKYWKKNRKLIQPTFNQKVLNQFVPSFAENSEIFKEILKKYVGKGEFDVYLPVSLCTLDSILETGIGMKFGTQTTDFQYSQWLARVFEIVWMRISFVPFHSDFIYNLSPQARECSKLVAKLNAFIGKIIEDKRKTLGENNLDFKDSDHHKAFLDLLLELEDGGIHFTNKQIMDETNTMIAAAMDTSATTSSYILIMLGMFPNLQKKVYDEVINLTGHDRSITADDLPNLKYLEMFIKETLRLFPSAPHMSRQPSENIKLGTTIVPATASFYLSILHLHRNGHIWKDPLKFDPERFLPEECAKRHPYSYIPFSGGPRSCIGMKYAMMLLKTLISTIIRNYKITTSYKKIEDIETTSDVVLRAKNGFKISIEERHRL